MQGSYAFNLGLAFSIPGYTTSLYHDVAIPDTWEVRIVNPNGVELVKTSSLTFPDPTVPKIFVPILSGELDKDGKYYFQVTKTTSGAKIKSLVGNFTVEGSIASLSY